MDVEPDLLLEDSRDTRQHLEQEDGHVPFLHDDVEQPDLLLICVCADSPGSSPVVGSEDTVDGGVVSVRP